MTTSLPETNLGVGKSINSAVDIRMQDAVPLNAGTCHFDGHLKVITDSGSGGYSALIPVVQLVRYQEPAVFVCDADVIVGSVGLSAVTADCKIISERVTTRSGRQKREILIPYTQDVAGILIRNFSSAGQQSRVIIRSIALQMYSAEKFLSIQQNRPSHKLRLPLRKQTTNSLQEIGESTTTIAELDTAVTAAIVVDAWRDLGERVASNLRNNLAPTLDALRSTGMAVIHAAHDRSIHPLVHPLAGETDIPGEFHDVDIIANTFSDAGIRNLIYLGYFSNMCVIQRSLGMLEMQKRGFNTILVRDASVAKETKESLAGEWFHKGVVQFVELNVGATITSADVQAAVSSILNRSG